MIDYIRLPRTNSIHYKVGLLSHLLELSYLKTYINKRVMAKQI